MYGLRLPVIWETISENDTKVGAVLLALKLTWVTELVLEYVPLAHIYPCVRYCSDKTTRTSRPFLTTLKIYLIAHICFRNKCRNVICCSCNFILRRHCNKYLIDIATSFPIVLSGHTTVPEPKGIKLL